MKPRSSQNLVTDKFLLVLEPGTSMQDMPDVAEVLNRPLVSSAALGSELPARAVYARGEGVYFKNLNIAVVDALDPRLAALAVRGSSPVMHVERERIVYAFASTLAPSRNGKTKQRPGSGAAPDFRFSSNAELFAGLAALRQNLLDMTGRIEEMEAILNGDADEDQDRSGPLTWGLRAVGWLNAGNFTGRGAKVAVLDTGLDMQHPDFAGRNVLGKTFVNVPWDQDNHGHGTHCAGTIAGGRTSDGNMSYGVAPDVDLVIGRVLDATGRGTSSGIVDAIDWALEMGCRVVSMSLGSPVSIGESPSPVYEQIGERALEQGCLIVAAAGNESRRPAQAPAPVGSPANAESILAVGAIDERLRMASFSNGGINAADGGAIDLVGPGVDVLSAGSTQAGSSRYVKMSGTSMATPHIAGLAALYLEADASRTGAELWDAMTADAQSISGLPVRDIGSGLAQAPRA